MTELLSLEELKLEEFEELEKYKKRIKKFMNMTDLHKGALYISLIKSDFFPCYIGCLKIPFIKSSMKSIRMKFKILKDTEPYNYYYIKPKKLSNPAIVQILFLRFLKQYGCRQNSFECCVMRPYYTKIQKVYARFLMNTFKKEMFIFYNMPMEYKDDCLIFSSFVRRWFINDYINRIIFLTCATRKTFINRDCCFLICEYFCNKKYLYVIKKVMDKLLFGLILSNNNRLKK